jgi:glycosyltransferase involved in cell wall biosynthesis
MLDRITPLVITWNEEANLERTLARLTWARRVVVLDSGSTDRTVELARAFANVELITRRFDSFAGQCNFGLTQITTPWVLSLDADYQLSEALIDELRHLRPAAEIGGYRASFVYCVYGRPLRGTLYPPRTVLHRVAGARYRDEGHGHRVIIEGRIAALRAPIRHDDRKPLERWFAAQAHYARLEADHLLSAAPASLGRTDRLRRTGFAAPPLAFAYTLLVARTLLDGWPGWFYALQRTVAEAMIALEIIDRRLRASRH